MRLLRITLIILLAAVTVLYGATAVSQSITTQNEPPSISGGDDILELSVADDKSVLLSGLTAVDAQDGNLTDEILLSGVSKFTDSDTATANATCLVFDSDGNMDSCVRTIRYTDYTTPRFAITAPLTYKASENIALLDRLHAYDCIDGDITSSIRVSSLTSTTEHEIYALTVQVTNSMGDSRELELELVWQNDNTDRPEVKLNAYLLYLDQGSSFDPSDYVLYADTAAGLVSRSQVKAEGTVDTDTPGTYFVHYSYNDGTATGTSILTVVVE